MICPKCKRAALMLYADGNCQACQTFTAPPQPRRIKSTKRRGWKDSPYCIECKTRKREGHFSRCKRCRDEYHRVCGIETKPRKSVCQPAKNLVGGAKQQPKGAAE